MGVFDFFKKRKPSEENITSEEIGSNTNDSDYKESFDEGLKATKQGFFEKIGKALIGKTTISEDFLDDLEEALVSADVGVQTTVKIIERLETRVAKDKYLNSSDLNKILKEEIIDLLSENGSEDSVDFALPNRDYPYVILVVGVNGVGKTTTIGKLAYQFSQGGNKVVLGAGDTFRAAAVDQLEIWAQRTGVDFISRGMNADPASVAFDAVQSAKARNADVCIIDTAGRLHNKVNLMNELSKIKQVMKKVIPDAPHEVLLVLDASTGQNAIEQAKQFIATTDVNAIALTKLDGTAKGGVVIAIADLFKIPIKYVGLGEKITDLKPFNKRVFINSLFD